MKSAGDETEKKVKIKLVGGSIKKTSRYFRINLLNPNEVKQRKHKKEEEESFVP
jgi:hypothetical protein